MSTVLTNSDAVIAVDVQKCFMPLGNLPVVGGDEILEKGIEITEMVPPRRRFASCDRHPLGHISFASSYCDLPAFYTVLTFDAVRKWKSGNLTQLADFSLPQLRYYLARVPEQRLWPSHAVIGTDEAELHPELAKYPMAYIQFKGLNPTCDSYSAWYNALGRPTGFGDRLREAGIKRCYLWGLALDYCVLNTAIDAAHDGFEVFVIEDATRAVDASAKNLEVVREMMRQLNVFSIQSSDLV